MNAATLFDAATDHYAGNASETESSYHFLNRASDPLWQRTRDLIEAWYTEFPDPEGDLRARFQSDNVEQHLAAWWELYTYTLFRCLGYDVEVHPTVPGSDKRPDFRVSRESSGMYVECAATAGDDVVENPAGQAWIRECINQARSPDFMVQVEITEVGTDHPSVGEIVRPIQDWLATLDYDILSELMDTTMDAAEEIFVFRDWKVRIVALPVNEASRGYDGRLIGLEFTGVRAIDEETKIRTVLKNKGRRYGTLNEPLIVALLSWSSWTNVREMVNALFGSIVATYVQHDLQSARLIRQRDGYWRPPPSTRGSRIAGVLFAESALKPWRVAETLPHLWLNPWAPTPVLDALPFTIHTADDDGNVVSTPTATTPQRLFGLSEEWSKNADQ